MRNRIRRREPEAFLTNPKSRKLREEVLTQKDKYQGTTKIGKDQTTDIMSPREPSVKVLNGKTGGQAEKVWFEIGGKECLQRPRKDLKRKPRPSPLSPGKKRRKVRRAGHVHSLQGKTKTKDATDSNCPSTKEKPRRRSRHKKTDEHRKQEN